MLSYDNIQQVLSNHRPLPHPPDSRSPAAVALILRDCGPGQEMLFIERALYDGDPWSGNVGFPGGKAQAQDRDEQLTAERETREEIGLDLGQNRYLGRLTDVIGAHLPVRVSCFVYGLTRPASLKLGDEVRTAFWVSLEDLCDPARHFEASLHFRGTTLLAPAIRVQEPGQTVLWGLTYRLVMQFLQLFTLPQPTLPVNPPVRF